MGGKKKTKTGNTKPAVNIEKPDSSQQPSTSTEKEPKKEKIVTTAQKLDKKDKSKISEKPVTKLEISEPEAFVKPKKNIKKAVPVVEEDFPSLVPKEEVKKNQRNVFSAPISDASQKKKNLKKTGNVDESEQRPLTSSTAVKASGDVKEKAEWKKKKNPIKGPSELDTKISSPPESTPNPTPTIISVTKSPSDISLYEGRKVGTNGQRVKVESNYLTLNLSKMVDKAYHYDIVFDPDKPKKCLKNVFNKFRLNFPNNFLAFDGWKSFYTSSRLDYSGSSYKTEVEYILDENREPKKFQITIKEVAELDLKVLKNFSDLNRFDKPQAAIQCLDIVLREVFNNNRTVKWHSSFFDAPRNAIKLGSGYELWIGLFQSAVLGWKPYLNIDVAHKAFPCAQSLIQYFEEIDQRFNPVQELDHYVKRDAEQGLKGFRMGYRSPFLTTQSNQYNLFNGFMDSAEKQTFTDEKGRKLTIAKYFEEKGKKLKYPKLPCIWVGNTVRNIYLPSEFCFIPVGQALNRKIPERCVANMIKQAATSTTVRKDKIFELLRSFSHNSIPVIKGFGLSVGNKFETFDARVLKAPILEYGGDKSIQPLKGAWRGESFKFLKPVERIDKWAVFNVDRRVNQSQIRDFEKMFVQISKTQGVMISPLNIIQEKPNPYDRDIDSAMTLFKKEKVALVIVIIPDSGNIYSKIKVSAETRFGMLTQCIKARTIFKMNISTAGNILLKVNTKLNGSNHKIAKKSISPIMEVPIMILGADVTHPSPEQKSIPSVVGVVASFEMNMFRYKISWRLQNPKDEMIRDLENIMIDSLNNYHNVNKLLPQKIFYFRDGVSEGQFKEIMNIELRAIQSACGRVAPNYRPNITFVIVQKRHHTRFFPTRNDQSEGKHLNVMPGTIVDTDIVHPNQFQYYLVSHASIQGVAKPTKYCILYDDSNLGADELQSLTYDLCHLFSRCNRTVSYPAPTYYAHLVAARGRAYIETSRIQLDKLDWEYESRKIQDNIINLHPMFFV